MGQEISTANIRDVDIQFGSYRSYIVIKVADGVGESKYVLRESNNESPSEVEKVGGFVNLCDQDDMIWTQTVVWYTTSTLSVDDAKVGKLLLKLSETSGLVAWLYSIDEDLNFFAPWDMYIHCL